MVSLKQHRYHWLFAVGIGLVGGLALSGYWPYTPLHAVATDRADTYAMATGPVDTEVEALYFLDFLTGELKAMVLGKLPGTFSGYFEANVGRDLGVVDPQKNPKFMMVTGMANLRRGGGARQQFGIASCYVAEVTTGKVAAYAIPWVPSMHASGQVQNGPLMLVGQAPFRNPAGSGSAAGGAAAKAPK